MYRESVMHWGSHFINALRFSFPCFIPSSRRRSPTPGASVTLVQKAADRSKTCVLDALTLNFQTVLTSTFGELTALLPERKAKLQRHRQRTI